MTDLIDSGTVDRVADPNALNGITVRQTEYSNSGACRVGAGKQDHNIGRNARTVENRRM